MGKIIWDKMIRMIEVRGRRAKAGMNGWIG